MPELDLLWKVLAQNWLLALILILLLVSHFTGRYISSRHLASLREREQATSHIPILMEEGVPQGFENARGTLMVQGHVVLGSTAFKRFSAGLRNIFGGRVTAYEGLVDRARREAILRMLADAGGPVAITCLRINTSIIGNGIVEVHACGTALYEEKCYAIR